MVFISRDPETVRRPCEVLRGEGYQVSVAGDLSGLEAARAGGAGPDIVVLDLDAAAARGAAAAWRFFERARALGAPGAAAPVYLLLSGALKSPRFAAEAIEKGAWDFLKKPAAPGVFTARVRLALRRRIWSELGAGRGGPVLSGADGRLSLSPSSRLLELREPAAPPEERRLTRKEAELLALFLKRPGVIFSKASLLELIWGYAVDIRTRTVDCHIKNLRRKMGPFGRLLETRYGCGYRLSPRD